MYILYVVCINNECDSQMGMRPVRRNMSNKTLKIQLAKKKSICIELNLGSYVVNYGFIYALCGGQVCLGLLHGKC